jgi:hypothetical protein
VSEKRYSLSFVPTRRGRPASRRRYADVINGSVEVIDPTRGDRYLLCVVLLQRSYVDTSILSSKTLLTDSKAPIRGSLCTDLPVERLPRPLCSGGRGAVAQRIFLEGSRQQGFQYQQSSHLFCSTKGTGARSRIIYYGNGIMSPGLPDGHLTMGTSRSGRMTLHNSPRQRRDPAAITLPMEAPDATEPPPATRDPPKSIRHIHNRPGRRGHSGRRASHFLRRQRCRSLSTPIARPGGAV